MSVLTGLPSSLIAGATSGNITLSPSALVTFLSISSAYWSNTSNWSAVSFIYHDATNVEERFLSFVSTNLVSTFETSATAIQNTWPCVAISIVDFDGGVLTYQRSQFSTPAEFDIAIVGADPDYADVELLLHMDGSNGSTTFTDNSQNAFTVTANGAAQISTAQYEFGGASGLFDGSTAYISVPENDAVFNLGTGDFTIEGWYYINGSLTYDTPLFSYGYGGQVSPPLDCIYGGGVTSSLTQVFFFSYIGGSGGSVPFSFTFSQNTWYNITFTRASGTLYCFVNGSLIGSTSYTNNLNGTGSSGPFLMGRWAADGVSEVYFPGYIDEFRLTVGVARYTSNYTPIGPFPNS
jgi:hypothetical protein